MKLTEIQLALWSRGVVSLCHQEKRRLPHDSGFILPAAVDKVGLLFMFFPCFFLIYKLLSIKYFLIATGNCRRAKAICTYHRPASR